MKPVPALLVASLVASLAASLLGGCAAPGDTDTSPLTRLKTPTANPLAAPPQSQDPNGGAS